MVWESVWVEIVEKQFLPDFEEERKFNWFLNIHDTLFSKLS